MLSAAHKLLAGSQVGNGRKSEIVAQYVMICK